VVCLLNKSKENYLILKRLGSAGDSFNHVVTQVLKKVTTEEENHVQNRHNNKKPSPAVSSLASQAQPVTDINENHLVSDFVSNDYICVSTTSSRRQTIDLIMIDLDLSHFKSRQVLDRTLSKTCIYNMEW
jgi:hypothetical protein